MTMSVKYLEIDSNSESQENEYEKSVSWIEPDPWDLIMYRVCVDFVQEEITIGCYVVPIFEESRNDIFFKSESVIYHSLPKSITNQQANELMDKLQPTSQELLEEIHKNCIPRYNGEGLDEMCMQYGGCAPMQYNYTTGLYMTDRRYDLSKKIVEIIEKYLRELSYTANFSVY